MDRNEILLKISESIAKIVEHNNFELEETTTAKESFSIKFKLMDLMNMNNIGDLISAIQTEL